MALPSSGTISLSQIAAEFGGSAPHSLSEYYGAASGVPTSGAIDFADFHGKSGVWGNITVAVFDLVKSVDVMVGYDNEDPGGPKGSVSPIYLNGAFVSGIYNIYAGINQLTVRLYGTRPANFFNSITINGQTFYTSSMHNHSYGSLGNGTPVTFFQWNGTPIPHSQEGQTIPVDFT